jgi:hypothetical protein
VKIPPTLPLPYYAIQGREMGFNWETKLTFFPRVLTFPGGAFAGVPFLPFCCVVDPRVAFPFTAVALLLVTEVVEGGSKTCERKAISAVSVDLEDFDDLVGTGSSKTLLAYSLKRDEVIWRWHQR